MRITVEEGKQDSDYATDCTVDGPQDHPQEIRRLLVRELPEDAAGEQSFHGLKHRMCK